jgi:hypothetical protein
MTQETIQPRKAKLDAIIVAAYWLLMLLLLLFHEPWRDEAESWLIARDLSFAGIIEQMGYQGTPALWHFLQAVPAKLGLPFVSLGILNAMIATSAVGVFVFCSPFARWQKAAFAFSAVMVQWFGLIWRTYALNTLLMFLAAAAYRDRVLKPLRYAGVVALLANGSLQSLGVAILLAAFHVVECAREERLRGLRATSALLMIAGIVVAVLQLLPAPDAFNPGLFPNFVRSTPVMLICGGFGLFAPYSPGSWMQHALCVAAFGAVLWKLRKCWTALWLVLLTYFGWAYVFTFKYSWLGPYHASMFAVVLLVGLWIARTHSASGDLAVTVEASQRHRWTHRTTLAELVVFGSLALTVPEAGNAVVKEIRFSFSNAREMALYIRQNRIAAPIATYKSGHVLGVLPHLPGRAFFQLETRRFSTTCRWTPEFYSFRFASLQQIKQAIDESFPNERPWLLLSGELPAPEAIGYQVAYRTQQPVWGLGGEQFWLYRPVSP